MALKDDLNSEVLKILGERWTTQPSRKVPELNALNLSGEAKTLEGAVLYADLEDSTKLATGQPPHFAAEIYKCYLLCAARIIESQSGKITAYDGDRIMAIYTGKDKETRAVRTALKINYAVNQIINPAIKERGANPRYLVKQVVGIDTSRLFVAKIGIRGATDIVWVGRAANYAAKLSGRNGAPTQITAAVFNGLDSSLKVKGKGSMWSEATAPEIGNKKIYTSREMRKI